MLESLGSLSALFAHPWAAAAGALLVSVPVVIHLINRLRFRRVKWAAMEFLLKAQKRVRRKMVIQQLLLLLLRCLLMILVGLLVARFFGFNFLEPESRETLHVVVLDDSPSMADPSLRADGTTATAFDDALTVLTTQIMKYASEATTRQRVEVYRLSDLANPTIEERLSDQTVRAFADKAKEWRPSTVRVPVADGLAKAAEVLAGQPPDVAKVVHVLTDFRAADWADGAGPVAAACEQLRSMKAKVNLVDTARPFRKTDDRRPPVAHDNIAITEFTPARLVAARYDPVEFTLRVRNNGAAEVRGVRFAILVNGDENKGRSVSIDALPGGQERAVKVEIPLDRVGTEDKPFERFSLVTAKLELPEPGGLLIDNARHAVVEVRDKLPLLVVDGRPGSRDARDGDGTYLKPVFTAVLGGYAWTYGTSRDLEQQDLSRFALVLLLNVPTLPDPAVKALEQYASAGGGVGFFLGPDVKAADYNKLLYRDGVGLFPVPLAGEPSKELPEDELQARRFRISQKKLLVRDPDRRQHPALAGLYTDERGQPVPDADQLERVFGFISVKHYWPVPKVGKWREDPSVTELYCLPNDGAMADYEAPVRQVADALPADSADAAKFKAVLAAARTELKRTVSSPEPLYKLAGVLDDLLADQRGTGDPAEALLREFWGDPARADLKRQAVRLRDAVKFGDPFYLAKDFGRGRVTVITTTAGETWSDWPSERPGSASYAPVMKELAGYLAGAGSGANRVTGAPVEFAFDPARTRPTGKRALLSFEPFEKRSGDPAPVADLGEVPLATLGDVLTLTHTDTVRPGAYLFQVTETRTEGAGGEVKAYRAAVVNVDALREGDLRRAGRDDVVVGTPGAAFHSAGDDEWAKGLRNKASDLSESWYLVALVGCLLLLEQWLATRLSFNASAA